MRTPEETEKERQEILKGYIKVNATTGVICPLRNGDACQYADCAWWITRVEIQARAIVEGCAVGVIAMEIGR